MKDAHHWWGRPKLRQPSEDLYEGFHYSFKAKVKPTLTIVPGFPSFFSRIEVQVKALSLCYVTSYKESGFKGT